VSFTFQILKPLVTISLFFILCQIDIIASDLGQPVVLNSRTTLTLIVVDDTNNAAQFDRMQICLTGNFKCEKDFESIIVNLKEEQTDESNSVQLNLAKMNDLTKSDGDICYYLSSKDKKYFRLNRTSGVLTTRFKLDREIRDKYELIIKSSEYCSCLDENSKKDGQILALEEPQCKHSNLYNDTYDPNDISQLKVFVYLDDMNDNKPAFLRDFYQVGITSDVDYGDVILESFVSVI
jgi:hypothetical protein